MIYSIGGWGLWKNQQPHDKKKMYSPRTWRYLNIQLWSRKLLVIGVKYQWKVNRERERERKRDVGTGETYINIVHVYIIMPVYTLYVHAYKYIPVSFNKQGHTVCVIWCALYFKIIVREKSLTCRVLSLFPPFYLYAPTIASSHGTVVANNVFDTPVHTHSHASARNVHTFISDQYVVIFSWKCHRCGLDSTRVCDYNVNTRTNIRV